MSLPTITKKQQEILLLLYRFRYLNRVQIQTLLHHKTFNRVIAWLNDLTEKKYIGKRENQKAAINIIPTKYHINENGIKFLKTVTACEKLYIYRLYTDDEKSPEFVDLCLLIADTYISLLKKFNNNKDFIFYTRSDFSVESVVKGIFPYFVYRKDDTSFYIVDFFKARPRFAIEERIKEYITFFSTGNGKNQSESTKILFVCPTDEIEDYVIRKVRANTTNLSIYTSPLDNFKQQGTEGPIWNKV